ncbi:MAG: SDR family NAD(P)-dependent oxidoreductase [Campylobacterota bacterium]|nr:SDR family NAD(P)-dependent oxidoreductase [Campylobacterota bacterium]
MKSKVFENKTVLVSGGTGYIGSAICREFYEQGATLYFTYHKNSEKADELIAQMPDAKALHLDLRDTASINTTIEKLYKEGVSIDILVNNAAMSQVMPLPMLDEEDVDMILDINIKSVIFLTKAVMRLRGQVTTTTN